MERLRTSALDEAPLWRLSPSTALGWALLLAIAISTQFLVQPFVWRNWSLDDILKGWISVAAADAVIAVSIATALVLVGRIRAASMRLRAVAVAVALLFGALFGEGVDRLVGAPTIGPLLGAVLRWSVISGTLTAIYYMWLRNQEAAARAEAIEAERAERARLASALELTALQRQIEPHFLFNTLATARGLYRRDPGRATDLLDHLARFLKSSLTGRSSAVVALSEELALVEAYLAVCQARMESRLACRIEVGDEHLGMAIPSLSVATLVENAVMHGIEPRPEGGRILVTAAGRAGGVLEITVEDDGVGFTASDGKGIGLANTRARLRQLYGADGQLLLAMPASGGVRAQIRLPAQVAA